jgi:uncharacterized membrane protein YeiH
MSGSPLDPMMHMLTSLAVTLGAAALVTLSAVMFLRWLGLHWTWTLPGVLLEPTSAWRTVYAGSSTDGL